MRIIQINIRLTALLLLLAILPGCAITNKFGPYKGQVIDAETKEPIEGAVVFMECYTATGTPAGATSHFYDAKEVVTDAKGEFYIALRGITFLPGHLWDYEPSITVFKPGYSVFPTITPNLKRATIDKPLRDSSWQPPENTYVTISLPKLETRELRLENLQNISVINVPDKKWEHLMYLEDIESIRVGLQPRYSNEQRAKRGLKLLPESIGKNKEEKARVIIRPGLPYPPK